MLRKLFLTCQIQASRDLKLDKLCSDYHSDKVVKVVVATLRKVVKLKKIDYNTPEHMAPQEKFCGPLWPCECVVSALQSFSLGAINIW